MLTQRAVIASVPTIFNILTRFYRERGVYLRDPVRLVPGPRAYNAHMLALFRRVDSRLIYGDYLDVQHRPELLPVLVVHGQVERHVPVRRLVGLNVAAFLDAVGDAGHADGLTQTLYSLRPPAAAQGVVGAW